MKKKILTISFITLIFIGIFLLKPILANKELLTVSYKTIPLTSQINNIKYNLYVWLPRDYDANKNYNVVYILDPMVNLNIITSFVGMLSLFPLHGLTDIMFVGVGYKNNDTKQLIEVVSSISDANKKNWFDLNRERDYLPIKPAEGAARTTAEFVLTYHSTAGQGELFKQVLETEVVPLINKKYKTTNNNTLFGHSYSGLFATYMFLNNSKSFSNYIAVAPALWYEKDWIFSLTKNTKIDSGKKIALIAGTGDPVDFMHKQVKEFDGYLKNQSQVKYIYKLVSPDDHFTILMRAYVDGLLFVFDKPFLQW